jgi:hypothetical protein
MRILRIAVAAALATGIVVGGLVTLHGGAATVTGLVEVQGFSAHHAQSDSCWDDPIHCHPWFGAATGVIEGKDRITHRVTAGRDPSA